MKTHLWLIILQLSLILSLPACQSSSIPASSIPAVSLSPVPPASPAAESEIQLSTDRDRDGLSGQVKAVLTDDVILTGDNNRRLESLQASSVSIYDRTGKRTVQTPFTINLPGGASTTEHESFFSPRGEAKPGTFVEHDPKGNVTMQGSFDGKTRRIEAIIKYEFDTAGNWIKREIARRVEVDGQPAMLPSEASYRHLVYFDSGAAPAAEPPAKPVAAKPVAAKPVAAAAQQLRSPVLNNEANLSAGHSLYNQKCLACHGVDGKAKTEFASAMTVKPEDLTGRKVRNLTEGQIYQVVSNGIKSAGMPPFQGRISDEALWQIVLYVKQLSEPRAAGGHATVAAASAVPPGTNGYPFKGTIVAVSPELQQVTVQHEEIPGYMKAMTMSFPLKNEKVLGKLKKGDRIEALLITDRNGWRLEKVEVK